MSCHTRCRRRRAATLALFSLTVSALYAATLPALAGTVKITSRAAEGVVIDGSDKEWRESQILVEDVNAFIGVAHDEAFLYLCLSGGGKDLRRQVMGRGLILWFDAKGGKKKRLGLRFPLGAARQLAEGGGPPPGRHPEDLTLDEPGAERFLAELELIGPEKDRVERVRLADLAGVEARLAVDRDSLVYELKIPLRGGEPYPFAIGFAPQSGKGVIGLGVETAKLDRGEMRKRLRDGSGGERADRAARSGGGRGGFGGGGRGGSRGGGFGGRGGGQPPKPIKFWVKISMPATGQTPTPAPRP